MKQALYKLPDGWEWLSLGQITQKTENINPLKGGDKLWTYIDISSINKEKLMVSEPKEILGKDAPSRAKKQIQRNDVIFATTRPNLKNIAILKSEYESPVASTGFCVLRATKDVLPDYLFYFVTTELLQLQIEPYVGGASYPAITDNNLRKALIPIPSLVKQKRIVEKLDALLTRIDTAIDYLQQKNELAKQLFDSLLDVIFKNAIGEETSLTEVADFIGGSQPPKSKFSDTRQDGYVRLVQIRDYKSDNHVVYVNAKSTKKFCTKDDVMIGRYGPPVFQILRGLDGAYNVALMKAVPREGVLLKDYLYWFLQSPSIQNYVIGISQRAAGQSGVNKAALEKYRITLPTLQKQNEAVDVIQALVASMDKLKAEIESSISNLKSLKSSILDSAFKGKL